MLWECQLTAVDAVAFPVMNVSLNVYLSGFGINDKIEEKLEWDMCKRRYWIWWMTAIYQRTKCSNWIWTIEEGSKEDLGWSDDGFVFHKGDDKRSWQLLLCGTGGESKLLYGAGGESNFAFTTLGDIIVLITVGDNSLYYLIGYEKKQHVPSVARYFHHLNNYLWFQVSFPVFIF